MRDPARALVRVAIAVTMHTTRLNRLQLAHEAARATHAVEHCRFVKRENDLWHCNRGRSSVDRATIVSTRRRSVLPGGFPSDGLVTGSIHS
jgi:hypothetical protein